MPLSSETKQRNASSVDSRNRFDWDTLFDEAADSSAGGACVPVLRVIREITESGDDAIILSQLIYWFRRGSDGRRRVRVFHAGEYWVCKTAKEWEEDTGIPKRRVSRSLERLRRQGFIKTEQAGFAGRKSLRHRLHPDLIMQAISSKVVQE